MNATRSGAEPLFIALDQGGHSSRALVLTSTGDIVTKAQIPIDTQVISDVRVEHKAEELAESLRLCCDRVAEDLGADTGRVASAGLATQRSSIACWQRSSGAALSPVLSWQDRRAADLIDAHDHESDQIRHLTGLVMSPHYGASKLRWCLTHLDDVMRAHTARDLTMGPLASYLVRSLTGSLPDVCDPANASRTLLWNRHSRDWSQRLCDIFDIDRATLPVCVPTRHSYGSVALGNRRVPLTLVTGDQSAAIYAFGPSANGVAYINLGTGAFMQCPIGQQAVDVDGLLNSVVYQDDDRTEYVLEGTVNGAGQALSWWSETHSLESKSLIKEAVALYTSDAAFAHGIPVFLNGISGLGSPFWISHFDSAFFTGNQAGAQSHRLTPSPQAGAIAILDSIAFLLTANIQRAASQIGRLERLVLTGGLASVDYLCQSLADVSGVTTVRSTLREATAKGVGFLLSHDSNWPGLGELVRFTPTPQSPVAQRHLVWSAHMRREIGKNTL